MITEDFLSSTFGDMIISNLDVKKQKQKKQNNERSRFRSGFLSRILVIRKRIHITKLSIAL
jgi:hypothetical protein